MRRRSLPRFLLGRLLVWLLPIACVGIALHWRFERALVVEAFDGQLTQRLHALAGLVAARAGRLEVAPLAEYLPEYSAETPGLYFQVWDPRGAVSVRSPSLRDADLPRRVGPPTEPVRFAAAGPGGQLLRCVGARFPGRGDVAEGGAQAGLEVVVGAPADELARALRGGLREVVTTGLISALAIIVAVTLTLRRGSQAISSVVRAVQALDPREPDRPLPVAEVPAEIWPLVQELNRHIGITAGVLEQERSFNGFVAHELRTPISEIRTAADVALRFPDAVDERVVLQEVHEVALRMGRTVEALLRLARLQAVESSEPDEPVDLAALVRARAEGADQASARGLAVRVEAPGSLTLPRGAASWSLVAENLVDNALEHSPAGSVVRVLVRGPGPVVSLVVENEAPGLRQADLGHLTERLWRGQGSPGAAGHSGLGLAIVAAACRRLGAQLAFALREGRLAVTVTLRA